VRRKFDEFVFRYRPLDLGSSKSHVTLCAALEKKGLLKPRQWAIGHTKVFMRNLQQQELEEAREQSLMTVVTKMTTLARKFICRCRYLRYKAILKVIKEAIAKRTEEALEAALTDVPELPMGGEHVPLVKEARRLKERLEDERRVTQMCKDAIKARDLNELKNACKAADDIAFVTAVVTEAKALRDLMEKEKAAVKRLKDACTARVLDEIVAAIANADTFGAYVTGTDSYNSVRASFSTERAPLGVILFANSGSPDGASCHARLTPTLCLPRALAVTSAGCLAEGAHRAGERCTQGPREGDEKALARRPRSGARDLQRARP
jgi:hypothetical protein